MGNLQQLCAFLTKRQWAVELAVLSTSPLLTAWYRVRHRDALGLRSILSHLEADVGPTQSSVAYLD